MFHSLSLNVVSVCLILLLKDVDCVGKNSIILIVLIFHAIFKRSIFSNKLVRSEKWTSKRKNMLFIFFSFSLPQSLMIELEQRGSQFNSVLDHGDALIRQRHPAAKTIEAYTGAMQTQWSWLLQLTQCLDTHLKAAAAYFKVRVKGCRVCNVHAGTTFTQA